MSVAAQALYGYGYSAPFAEFLERPVACEFADLKQVTFLHFCLKIKLTQMLFISLGAPVKFFNEIYSQLLRCSKARGSSSKVCPAKLGAS